MPKAKTTFTIMIAAIIAACIAPASASADCLTAMIVDHSAAALLRYESCRNVEGRLQALEQAERDRQETRRAPEWAPRPNALSALYEGYAQSRTVTKAEFEEAKRHLFQNPRQPNFRIT
jgi:hypothetical protein